MITLNKECLKHSPRIEAISFYAENSTDLGTEYTFCEVCENNISRFMSEDPDKGYYMTKWSVIK